MTAGRGTVPAVASSALRRVLAGERRRATQVGASGAAAYLQVEDGGPVVAVVTRDAVRLPNALVADPAVVATVARAGTAMVGGGRLEAGAALLTPARWFDPRPRLGTTTAAVLGGRLEELAVALPPWHPGERVFAAALQRGYGALTAALTAGDADRAEAAATGLIGLGPGLTPAGDDVVAGALAALQLLGPAIGEGAPQGVAAALVRAAAGAPDRTGVLSAALLRHAAHGEVAAPAADLLRALAGRGPVAAAAVALLEVGHSSGHDLARGILAGGRGVVAPALEPAESA